LVSPKSKGYLIDCEKVLSVVSEKFKHNKLEIFYYTAYPEEGTRNNGTKGLHDLFLFLNKSLGFNVRKKKLKVIRTRLGTKEKGDMDV